ncbi:MAG: 4-hydroxy-tetrahydrodipicolinate reductase [Alphaproteobacteria bacterium]|nr:4-hydroxy-tetrahydrodipicolinate reductase [Alphaproteobacteria bacterium]
MSSIRIAIAGRSGRMARALREALQSDADFEPVGHICAGDDPLPIIAQADALLDFTTPAASVALSTLTAQARIVHVLGTTGFKPEDESKIRAAARHAVIVKSGNMSLAVALLAALVERVAAALPDFDLSIVEMHHRAKRDAPSGTALLLGKASGRAEIGYASLRGGTVVGEHQALFFGPKERIVLSHSAEDRSIFAHGALAAAKWGQGKKPGLYAMADVLGL